MIDKIKDISKELPEKKKYFEFIASILSIPILITVLITNANNLSHMNSPKTEAAEPKASITETQKQPTKIVEIIREATPKPEKKAEPTAEPTEKPADTPPPAGGAPTAIECKKQLGPVDIISPGDGETVTRDPLMIDISYKLGEYCAAVWSYRINDGDWSEYSDKSISVFNLSNGTKKLEVRVKSVVAEDNVVLRRTFTYAAPQEASSSAHTP